MTPIVEFLTGCVYVFFLPGLVLSYAFLSRKKIGILERAVLSFALSMSVVPLLVFYLNLLGLKITLLNVSLVVFGVVVIGGVYALINPLE